MQLKCENCGYKWNYQGESEAVAECPNCQQEVNIPAKLETEIPDEEIDKVLKRHPSEPSSMIPVLQDAQDKFGYVPRKVMERIAEYLNLPESKVYGVATFYAQFRFEPLGDHLIKVCHGTACHVNGAESITETIENELGIKTGETTEDGSFTLERVACLGCCSLAPVIMVDDTAHGNLNRDKVKEVLEDYRGE